MNPILTQLQNSFGTFWAARSARERKQIGLASVVVTAALLYMLFIAPALNGKVLLEKSLPELRLQAAEMLNLAKEATNLSAITATPVPAMSKETLEGSLAAKGLKPQSVAMAGDVAKVQLTAASFAGLLDWMDEMQKTARITVVEANIVAQTQPDSVNATLTLRQ